MRLAVCLAGVLLLALAFVAHRPASAANATRMPVLVELFTSEGCSSCPPVDKLVADLQQQQPVPGAQVVLLSFHVDYWNQLGWTDRFSSHDYSARQERYAQLLSQDSVYTPELVVDGSEARPDLLKRQIDAAAASAKPIHISLTATPAGAVRISAAAPATARAHMYAALTEDGLTTSVRTGENGGRTLFHSGVVRQFADLGAIANGSFGRDLPLTIDSQWQRSRLTLVTFAQDEATGKVLGVTSLPISTLTK